MASQAASRTPARAARSAASGKFPLMPSGATSAASGGSPVEAPPPPARVPAPAPEPTPPAAPEAPEPTPERQYSLEIRLDSAALTGDSAYHVTWPESRVRALLSGALTWVPVPVRPHLPGHAAPMAARFVYIQAIAEVVIHGWPQDDQGQ